MQARFSLQRFAAPGTSARNGLVTTACLGAAALVCAVVLAGWSAGISRFTGYGGSYMVMQPLTAIAHLCIAAALYASMRARHGVAIVLLIFSLMIATSALLQNALILDFGIDRILFPDRLATLGRSRAGRPGTIPAITILLLSLTTFLSMRRGRRANRAAVLFGSLTIGITLISAAAFPLEAAAPESGELNVLMSIPTGLATILNAIAAMMWRHDRAWPGLFSVAQDEKRSFRMAYLLCVLAPATFALIELWCFRNAGLKPATLEIIRAVAQSLVSVTILFWAWSWITRASGVRDNLTRALDSAPIAIVTLTGEILRWSKGCERLYQWTAEEAVGHNKHELLHASSHCPPDEQMEFEREIVEYRRDGSMLDILEQARLVQEDPNAAPVLVLSMTDITARKKAEEALRASDARLALAVEVHEIGIFEWDMDSDRTTLSSDAERLLGLPLDGVSGGMADLISLIQQQFHVEFFPELTLVLKDQLPRVSFLFRAISPYDPPYRVEGSARCFYSKDGNLSRLIGVLFDASEHERRAAEMEARESELRAILETVPEALVTIDTEGRILSFSTTAEKLFGYGTFDVIGRDVGMLMPESFRAEYRRVLDHYRKTGENHAIGLRRWTGLRRDGSEIPIEFTVGEADVRPARILTLFVRDLSEQIASQMRLSELREELLHVSRLSAMGEMAAGLAHELNQPLATMINFLGAAERMLANENVDKGEVTELLRRATGQSMHAGEIIRRVRTFASRGEVEFGPQQASELIADSIDLALTSMERKTIDIAIDIDPAHDRILADRVQIQQVLVNMIQNATEAMRDADTHDPQIRFTTRDAEGGMIEIAVQDNGPGIPADILNRHHEHFVSTKAHGMGIGLSICRRIIEAHRGHLSTGNSPEAGAIIRFTIPAFPAVDRPAADRPVHDGPAEDGGAS
jgi:two-component system sensor kinase FixL